MGTFTFGLGQRVWLVESGETGTVTGRAEWAEGRGNPSYMVLYKAGDGRQVESWWNEAAISSTPPVDD